jgi:hypothetical protein
MTFFLTGLICWGYVLLDDVQNGTHMVLITLVPTMAVIFIWLKCGGKPGKTAHTIIGQIVLAGIVNGLIMGLLGPAGVFLGIPMNALLLVVVAFYKAGNFVSGGRTA